MSQRFEAGDAATKMYTRTEIGKHLGKLSNRKNMVCVTLPNTSYELEKYLIANFHIKHIFCYENNPKTYERSRKIASNYPNIILSPTDVLNVRGLSIDFVWLDLCASFQCVDKVIEFMKNNHFKSDALIAVTFCKQRGTLPVGLEEEYKDYKNVGFQFHMLDVLPLGSEVIAVENYQEKPYSALMSFFIFKTPKKEKYARSGINSGAESSGNTQA